MKKTVSSMVLFCGLILACLMGAVQGHRHDRLDMRLTQMHRGTLLSALRQMEDMQLSLKKALLSASPEESSLYLSDVSDKAGQALRSLSLLPLSHPDTMQAMKLSNQLGDYAKSLMESGGISPADANKLAALADLCREYTLLLYEQEDALLEKAAHASFYPEKDAETVDQGLNYPTLIYDGPFSDARQETPLPLEGEGDISWEDAAQIATAWVGADRVLSTARGTDTLGPNPCHGITLTLPDLTLEAAVTKKGGKVLWITPDRGGFEPLHSLEECKASALAFLRQRGFPEMESTFFQVYEGVAVIAFAAKQGDVLIYPDLVKVQLRMDTGEVVGLEAKNYWQHHKIRFLPSPGISQADAREQLSPLLQISESRLCLIPKNGEEILCWEWIGQFQGEEYRVYTNAHTGEQEDLLQILESSTGLEAV